MTRRGNCPRVLVGLSACISHSSQMASGSLSIPLGQFSVVVVVGLEEHDLSANAWAVEAVNLTNDSWSSPPPHLPSALEAQRRGLRCPHPLQGGSGTTRPVRR